ncbi:N-acetylmuramic acid 6-phosphate etherase [bacterium]|nr:N-acetylmuramic acid 6-phosphate etherase [bacterium]
MNLDRMSIREILEAMNREDRKLPAILAAAIPDIERAVELVVNAFQRGGRLIYVGAGTSGRLGVLDAAECPPTFGTEPHRVQGFIAGGFGALVRAVEGKEDEFEGAALDLADCCINEEDVLCGIAASRRTPYVLGALSYAGARGAKRIFLICNEKPDFDSPPFTSRQAGVASSNSPPFTGGQAGVASSNSPPFTGGQGGVADVIVSLPVGPELLTGSTRLKAGTATKLALNMITTAAWVRMGKCYENLMVDLRQGSLKLQARARRIFMEITGSDYEWADEMLKQAEGELKTALVMHFKGLEPEHAREEINQHKGNIISLIGD